MKQVVYSSTIGEAILDLSLTSTSELIGDVRTGGCLDCTGRSVVYQRILKPVSDMGVSEYENRLPRTAVMAPRLLDFKHLDSAFRYRV